MERNENKKKSNISIENENISEQISFDSDFLSSSVNHAGNLPDSTETIDNSPVDDFVIGNFINSRCKLNASIRENISWSQSDIALIELYNMHQTSGVPISLFNKTITWLKRIYQD